MDQERGDGATQDEVERFLKLSEEEAERFFRGLTEKEALRLHAGVQAKIERDYLQTVAIYAFFMKKFGADRFKVELPDPPDVPGLKPQA